MIKYFVSMLLLVSVLFGDISLGKPTGCDLSQDGDVIINIDGYASSKSAIYVAKQKIGKNFKELFIGSTISISKSMVIMTDITSNKRVKGKARTGVLTITLIQDGSSQKIKMPYTYLNGYFEAKGKQQNSKNISIVLKIKALLCYSK